MVSFEIRGIVYGRKKEIKLEIQLLPKDLLTDLEKGDRTMEMLRIDSVPFYHVEMGQTFNTPMKNQLAHIAVQQQYINQISQIPYLGNITGGQLR